MSAENRRQQAEVRESKARKNTGAKSKKRRGRLKRRAADRHQGQDLRDAQEVAGCQGIGHRSAPPPRAR